MQGRHALRGRITISAASLRGQQSRVPRGRICRRPTPSGSPVAGNWAALAAISDLYFRHGRFSRRSPVTTVNIWAANSGSCGGPFCGPINSSRGLTSVILWCHAPMFIGGRI